jgi:hypothetical protein
MVTTLAYDTDSQDINGFYASIESYTHKLLWLNLVMNNRFTTIDEGTFSFTLKDSDGNLVADETMGHLEFFTPVENDGFGFETFFYFDEQALPVVDADESYTVTYAAGIFSTVGGEQSTELVVDYVASEFISERDGIFGLLDYMYNMPVLRVIFAPLFAIIEFIFSVSVYFAMR